MEFLVSHGADVTIQLRKALRRFILHITVGSSSLAVLKMFCEAGGDVHLNTQDDFGLTPLHTAVNKEEVGMVQYLLEQGASPNLKDLGGNTPLQLAIRNQNREIVLLLYPRTTVDLSSITASDLRRCSGTTGRCHIEMTSIASTQVAFRNGRLSMGIYDMSYPLSFSFSTTEHSAHFNFMDRHFGAKHML